MRLHRTVVAERETFVRELFRADNTMTGTEAQRRIKEKFGQIMRFNRIYELRTEVLAGVTPSAPLPEGVTDVTPVESTTATPTTETQI